MLPFEKKKQILVCVDSDGTIMDTMTVKHERCFGPMLFRVFSVEGMEHEILNHWLHVNLYSTQRGINRFQGFDEICHFMADRYHVSIPGLDEFDEWVTTTKELSVKSMNQYRQSTMNDSLFAKAEKWSSLVNEAIRNLAPSQPFSGVKEILSALNGIADLVGVSSANREAVEEEWNRVGIISLFSYVGCQDIGNKTLIIKNALENGYDKKNVIMLGDALGDKEAAEKNGVRFFPIVPKHEIESWEKFYSEAFCMLSDNRFTDDYQERLNEDFINALK